jgi:hypothetical protein
LEFPEALRAGAAQIPSADFKWQAGVPSDLRTQFSRETCNGCHGGETKTLPFQHIAPALEGQAGTRLSHFLHDGSGKTDELARRERLLRELLTTNCDATPSPYPQR